MYIIIITLAEQQNRKKTQERLKLIWGHCRSAVEQKEDTGETGAQIRGHSRRRSNGQKTQKQPQSRSPSQKVK